MNLGKKPSANKIPSFDQFLCNLIMYSKAEDTRYHEFQINSSGFVNRLFKEVLFSSAIHSQMENISIICCSRDIYSQLQGQQFILNIFQFQGDSCSIDPTKSNALVRTIIILCASDGQYSLIFFHSILHPPLAHSALDDDELICLAQWWPCNLLPIGASSKLRGKKPGILNQTEKTYNHLQARFLTSKPHTCTTMMSI